MAEEVPAVPTRTLNVELISASGLKDTELIGTNLNLDHLVLY